MRNFSAIEERAWLVVYLLVCGGSVALALLLAFGHSVGAFTWPPSPQLNWSGWRTLSATGSFWQALGYSLTLTVITLFLAVLSALLLLAGLGARVRAGWLARALFLPLAVPPVVAALLAFSLLSDSGWLSRIAYHWGWLATPADFPTLIFDPAGRGIVLTHLAMITPLFVLLFDSLTESLRLPLLLRQAQALGASHYQAWQRVALPLLLRQAWPVIAVYGVALLGAYELPLLIGAARPSMVSVTIARAIAGVDLAQQPLGYAMASVYLAILILSWTLFTLHSTARGGRQ